MKKLMTIALIATLSVSCLAGCGSRGNSGDTLNQQVEVNTEVSVDASIGATVESTEESSEEASESVAEKATEEVSVENSEEISDDDAMENIQDILAQAQKELLDAKKDEESAPKKEYDFPEGYDSEKYTWRQTTADRNLYLLESNKELIGREFIGETFEEILQMAEDPTCDFDEENFFKGLCFEGLTVKDVEYLVNKGYTVDQLVNMVVENSVGNVKQLNIWQ